MKTITLVLTAALLTSAACGEGDETSGRRVVLQTRLVSDAQPGGAFTPSSGWSVTLTEARIATGPLYYFDGAPALTARSGAHRFWAWLSPIGTAHAHPGHYAAGKARGNMLLPYATDLLAGPVALPAGEGITGIVRSGTFSYAAPSAGPAAPLLAGHVAEVSGSASKAGKTVHFKFAVGLADVAKTAKDGHIEGCPFNEAEITADGTVTVTVKPRVWFNLVDFDELAPGSAVAPTLAGPDTTAHIAFALGLTQLSAYQFTLSP